MEGQQQTLLRLSEGLLGLVAHVKVAGDAANPVLGQLKGISKALENSLWQLGGSGKLANCSVKEHLLSHGKLLGQAAVTATKSFEVLSTLVEGVDALNKTEEETNGLLRELVEGQKLALEKATKGGVTPPAGGMAPPVFPPSMPNVAPVGSGQGVPAAFQTLGGGSGGCGGVPKIPGPDLPQPPPPMTTNPMSAPPTARLTLWAQALALKPWNVKGLQGSSA